MKYVPKVGEEFDLDELPAQVVSKVTVNVNVGAPSEGNMSPSAWKVGLVVFVIFCALVVMPATAYGFATGDFSFIHAIARNFNDLAAAMTKAAITAMDKK